ncbi:hypothetical protein GJ496_011666 [Pomphorhynchus laevis]|nr:hypothetical protein GJ496_011666 [Pomphorhynchus laevis]
MAERVNIVALDLSHFKSVINLFCTEYKSNEPLSKEISVDNDLTEISMKIIKNSLSNCVSAVAVDEQESVIGFLLASRHNEDDKFDFNFISKLSICKTMSRLLEELHSTVDIRGTIACNTFLYITDLCVSEHYRGKGIALKLINKSIELGREHKLQGAVAECTSDLSKHVFTKLGFQEYGRILPSDFKRYKKHYPKETIDNAKHQVTSKTTWWGECNVKISNVISMYILFDYPKRNNRQRKPSSYLENYLVGRM